MIEQKENDWVLNLLSNSNFSTADFKSVGLTAENTSLQSEETYKSSKQIQDLFQREDGTFDNEGFHKFYENAQLTYNMLANDTFMDDMYKQQAIYGKDNIFAPREQRRDFAQTVQHTRVPNPDRTVTGLIRVGETSDPKMSRSELAQTQRVLVNPTEVYDKEGNPDWSKAQWHESPNDSWFEDFFDTRVLAQWESDGEHVDPITGKTVKHQKGQAKLNEEGTYYYENLDGRDIYGKQVLNKMNTLTTDGSYWNKYDFFDSDSLEQKSAMGSIMKNAALVGTMFIPYVGPWIAGLSVASQLVGLSGTLGKMLTGSDSPTFSALEGWSKSVNRQTAKSQYAMENTWCWENFINLIGDVAGQLKEQRFLFEFTPAMFKGTKMLGLNGISQTKSQAYALERAKHYDELLTTKFKDMEALRKQAGKALTEAELKSYTTAKSATTLMGNADADKFMKSYQHIGEILSKGYMTAITVGDTYGEAKYEAGASDTEATLLTLGYAAAEAALLNTGVGEWILPELKASGLKTKAIIKAIAEAPEAMRLTSGNILAKEGKKESAKYWFTKGKEVAESLMSKGGGLVGTVVSGGLGEGVEEMAEEFLADFSKSCFNTVQWLKGSDKRMSAWDNMADRYLMSLVGGAVGGGLTAAGTNFKISTQAMSSEQAMQEMIFMLRENKKDELFKTLNKMTLANPYLQNESEKQADGTITFKAADSNSSNMDKDLKKAFVNQVNLLDNIIKAEGIKLSDNAFLDAQTFRDIRLANLQHSSISGLYLQDFNSLCSEIVQTQNEISTLSSKTPDSGKPEKADEDHLQALNKKLLDLRMKKDQYVNGELAMDYTSLSLFEMTPIVSQYFSTMFFKDYVDKKHHRKVETLSETELKKYREEFDNWKQNEGKNDIVTKGHIYLDMARNSGLFIQEFAKNYDNIRKSKSLQDLIKGRLKNQAALNMSINPQDNLVNDTIVELDTWMNLVSKLVQEETTATAISMIHNKGSKSTKDNINLILQNYQLLDKNSPTFEKDEQRLSAQIQNTIARELAYNADNYFDEFIATGAINPEIKNSLLKTVYSTKNWVKELGKTPIPSLSYLLSTINGMGFTVDESTRMEDLINNWAYDEIKNEVDLEEVIEVINNTYQQLGIGRTAETLGDIKVYKDELAMLNSNLDRKADALENVSYTDSIQFIQNFIQSNSDSGLDMPKLIETVNAIIDDNVENLGAVNLTEVIDQIDEAIEVVGWLQGLVIGAQSDSNASLDNLVGYNVTLNEIAKKHRVADWEALPVISTQDSQIINQDLQLIKNKLIHAKNIHAINQGKKLNLQNRVAANKNYITYNRLKKFIVNVDDSWAEKKTLEDALESAAMLKKFAEKRQQTTDANRKEMEKEMIKIDDAFYSFFNNEENVKKIKNGDLYTLFQKDFDLYGDTDQLINEDTKVLDDRNLLYWLASRAAIKKSAFNNELRQVIDPESGLAPIPTQQEAVFHNIAEIMNGDLITAFTDGYKKAMLQDWNGRSDDSKKDLLVNRLKKDPTLVSKYLKHSILDIDIFPKYSNMYLTEGIPGAGKSKAVDYYTAQILKKFHGDIVKNAWLINNTKPNAEKLAKSLGMEFKELFDKNGFMSRIYSKYNTSRAINKNGAYVYDKSEWVKNADGVYEFNGQSDDLTEVPSLIIIDEISHYDQADLQLINDFARKNGITVITSGDFQQSTTLAEFKNEEGTELTVTPTRGLFKHSPKLGVSMRSNNSQMDKTIAAFQAHSPESKKPIDTYWYMDDNGFNGVKQVLHNEDAEIEKVIDHMIATANVDPETGEKEKIGFIYFSDDSHALKILERKYAGKYEKFKGTSAQGLEGQYYIIDFHGSERDNVNKKQDLYTGISRAEQGALVIYTKDIDTPQELQQHQETATTKTGFDKNHLKSYAIDTKKLLDELCGDSTEFVSPKERAKITTTRTLAATPAATAAPVVSTPPKATPAAVATTIAWAKPDEVKDFIYKGNKYATDGVKVAKYNSAGELELLEDSDPLAAEVLTAFKAVTAEPELGIPSETSEETTGAAVHGMSTTEPPSEEPIVEAGGKLTGFTYLLHSHNTFELGLKVRDNKLEFLDADMKRYEHRIDSAIGLAKVYEADWKNPKKDADFYIEKIAKLRNALFNIEDKAALMNYLGTILDDANVTDLEFGLVSAPNIKKASLAAKQKWGYGKESGKYGMLDRNVDERTLYNDVNPEINRKTIGATITLEGGKRVFIPLFVLGNLETYTRNPKSAISQQLKKLYDENDGLHDPYAFHEAVINDPVLQKVPEIYNLAKLWVFTQAGYFKIDDSSWTPAKNLRNWGMQVNTNATSGGRYPYEGAKSFTPIKSFLEGRGYNFSKQIYTSLDEFEDGHGNLHSFANRGHSFILVTQDPSLDTDEKMEEQYKKQKIDKNAPKKVTLIYLMPPKVPIRQYLKNLYDLVNEKDDRSKIKRLGSHLTSYYIWSSLLDKLDNPIFNTIDKNTKEKLKEEITRLKGIEDSIAAETNPDRKAELMYDLLNEVLGPQTWEGVATSRVTQSLQEHLNYQLLNTFMSMADNSIIPENFEALAKVIEEAGIEHIFYSPKFRDKVPVAGRLLIPLQSDQDLSGNSTYTIDGLDFSINAKLDSNLFSIGQEFNDIIENFVTKIIPNTKGGGIPMSTDTNLYLNPVPAVAVGDTNIDIALEDNGLGVDKININISPTGMVTINGNITILTPDDARAITFYTKDQLKVKYTNSLPLHLVSEPITDLIDQSYDFQIRLITERGATHPIDDMWSILLNGVAEGINSELSDTVAFVSGDKVIARQFTSDELDEFGLEDGIELDTELNFKGESVLEVPYKGIKIIFNKADNTIKLFKEPVVEEPPTSETISWAETPIEGDFLNWLDSLGIDMNQLVADEGWSIVSDMWGYDEVIDKLTENEVDDPQLKSLIDYLTDDNNDPDKYTK